MQTIRKSLMLGILAVIMIIGIATAAETDTILLDLNITQLVSIDVTPNSTSWLGVGVGSTTSPNAFNIQNVGSVNISTVDASITNADDQAYGTGVSTNFNAGDFILINSTNNATFYYINKIEYNESVPAYVTPPADYVAGGYTGSFGRMRTVSGASTGVEYLFFTNRTATSGNCSSSGVVLLGVTPKTVASSGDVDFTNSGNYTVISLTAADSASTGVGEVPSGHALTGYCVQVNADCGNVTFFHFNMNLDGGGDCAADQYVYGSDNIQPGSTTEVWLEAKIPLGVSDGDLSQGTLTFTAAA